MLFLEYAFRLIGLLAWPSVALATMWLARRELKALIGRIGRIKFKDFEVEFRERLEEIERAVNEALPGGDDRQPSGRVNSLIEQSPSLSILEAWAEIERAATEKVRDLVPPGERFNDPTGRPLEYLVFKGALVPSAALALRDLEALRNDVAHIRAATVSLEDAVQYAKVANRVRWHIEAILELPAVKLTALTLLILELNHLIDSGKHNDVTIEEVKDWIRRKDVLSSLAERVGNDADLSMFKTDGPYSNFSSFYHDRMRRLYDASSGDERRKWGIENLGLCLLLAWTNELIQQGSGWHPNEN